MIEVAFQVYKEKMGTSLAVQWLRLCASNAGGMDSIPGWGTKIPHGVAKKKEKKKKKKKEKMGAKTTKVRTTKFFLPNALLCRTVSPVCKTSSTPVSPKSHMVPKPKGVWELITASHQVPNQG